MERRGFLRAMGIGAGAAALPAVAIAARESVMPNPLGIIDQPWKKTVIICGVEYSYAMFETFGFDTMEFIGPFRIRKPPGCPVEIEKLYNPIYTHPMGTGNTSHR